MDTYTEEEESGNNGGVNVCVSSDTEHEVTFKPQREAAQRANVSIHSILVKKPRQTLTLTMPKTPDVLK